MLRHTTHHLTAAVAVAATLLGTIPPAAAAVLTADYRLQGTLASSVGTAPDLANFGPGANTYDTETVDGVDRTVLSFPSGNGVLLTPTTGVLASDRYSVVILFLFAQTNGYRRILDFKNGQTDNGLYVDDSQLEFYPNLPAGGTINGGTYVQVVLTRDGAGNVIAYVDGAQALTFADGTDAVIDSNNTLRFFVDNDCSAGSCGEESGGDVARIRLFDDALTPSEVAALDRLPSTSPTTTTPTSTTTSTTGPPSGCSDFATRAQIDAECDCGAATKHGPYVHCAVQVINRAVKAGTLAKARKGAVKKCAARSTCGKPGFVTCCRTTAKGVTKCLVKPDAAKCKAPKGGTASVGEHASCCDACTANGCGFPSPAFVDVP